MILQIMTWWSGHTVNEWGVSQSLKTLVFPCSTHLRKTQSYLSPPSLPPLKLEKITIDKTEVALTSLSPHSQGILLGLHNPQSSSLEETSGAGHPSRAGVGGLALYLLEVQTIKTNYSADWPLLRPLCKDPKEKQDNSLWVLMMKNVENCDPALGDPPQCGIFADTDLKHFWN